ncbi:MAG TPA: hypothetical protein ENH87_03565 [Pricia antarctica]|uniref:Uncharacterized protein n=1 Tax=Pricia antarctica TaxID=641691 RepID=A0A831QN69_9FLAO|nr:hypothetical protein [Pricia antarctica]
MERTTETKNKIKYQPSNGDEGIWFTEKFCMRCKFCDPDPLGERQCEILGNSMAYSVSDPEYPEEWIYDKDENPICTKHKLWDWAIDGEPEFPIYDPNQLSLFELTEQTD